MWWLRTWKNFECARSSLYSRRCHFYQETQVISLYFVYNWHFNREVATSAPYDYKAPTFFTAALQSSNVEITWDQTDYNRLQLTTKKFNKDEMREDDFRAYLASDSEESEDDLPQLEDEYK